MSEILVLCPFGLDPGLLSEAASWSLPVRAVVPAAQQEEAALYGAGIIHALGGKVAADEAAFAAYLANSITRWGSTVILAPATVPMRNLMPLLAWKLKAGLTADCTSLRWENGRLLQTRPAFGNSLMAAIHTLSRIQMATVRPGIYPPLPRPESRPTVYAENFTAEEAIRAVGFTPYPAGKPLVQADIILSGGMGVGSKAGFEKLEQLAEKLGAGLGATRTAVDAGFAPFRCQVGMTGVTVRPRLYIAVGISGAVQHLAGMSGAEKVIAINADPKAPIFDYADYGIVGDWETVIDRLLEELS